MQNIGFVKLHRKIRDNPIFWKPNYLAVFMYILLDVEYSETKKPLRGDLIDLRPGEGLFFQKEIADKFGIALGTVSNILKKLNSENIIEIKTNSKYTIIGLINWEAYQGELENTIENELKTDWNPTETEMKHLKNTNNTKNTKKEKVIEKKWNKKKETEKIGKIEEKPSVFLLPDEIAKLKDLYGSYYIPALDRLSSYKLSNGKDYKSDYATLHSWGWVYRAIIKDFPTITEKIRKLSEEEKKKKEEEAKRAEQESGEIEYQKLLTFFSGLSEEIKKQINERADYELKNWTQHMREYGGKSWENVYKAKVRAVTSHYRDTGIIEEIPPPPPEEKKEEVLPPNAPPLC